VELHGHADSGWGSLISFWAAYNRMLAGLAARIPETALDHHCRIGSNPPVTLRFLIEDYIAHMEHHLDRILERQPVRSYPSASFHS